MLSWEPPTRIIEYHSCLCTGHAKSHTLYLRVLVQMLNELCHAEAVTTSLVSYSSAQPPLPERGWKTFLWYPT